MKRVIVYFSLITALVFMLTGCGKAAAPAPTTTPAFSETATAMPAPTPLPSPAVLSTDIPDISPYPEEYMTASNHGIAEDEKNIYLQSIPEEGSPRLYAISKTTGEITRLIDTCYNFAYSKNAIYWIQTNTWDNATKIINRYDIKTETNTTIATLEKDAYSLMADGKKLYLTYAGETTAQGEPFTGLYTMGTDGKGLAEAAGNVFEAALYKGKVYFTTHGEDGSTVHEYDPATGEKRQLTEASAAGFYFDIAFGKLFFCGMEAGPQEGLCMLDMETGKVQKFEDDATNEFTMAGQYFLYIAAENANRILTAYDILTGKRYKLADVTGMLADDTAYTSLRATDQNAYLNVEYADGTFALYKITVENGKGNLVKVTK